VGPSGALSMPGFPCGSSARVELARLTGLGPPVPRCTFVGRGPVLPIVFGLEASGTTRYADLPVVHSERKFQSHPAVPPARLIELALAAADWGGLRVDCPGELNPMISPSESSGVADEQACPTCCRDDRVVGPSSTGR